MKCLITYCCVVGLLQIVVAQNSPEIEKPVIEYPLVYDNKDHSILWGSIQSGDILLTEEVIYQNGVAEKEVVATSSFEGESDITITAIKVIPNDADSFEGTVNIIEGGIGQKTAVVQFTSKTGLGNYFTVSFYGRLE